MTRVLWDAVPQAIKDELAARGPARMGEHAICDAVPGQRWYFRRTNYGWNHLSTDLDPNRELASDLTPEQRAKAAADVERLLKKMELPRASQRSTSSELIRAWVERFVTATRGGKGFIEMPPGVRESAIDEVLPDGWAKLKSGWTAVSDELVEVQTSHDGYLLLRLRPTVGP